MSMYICRFAVHACTGTNAPYPTHNDISIYLPGGVDPPQIGEQHAECLVERAVVGVLLQALLEHLFYWVIIVLVGFGG